MISALSPAYSLSIFKGPLCETRHLIHGPDHFNINWFTYISGKRGSLLAGDIHMGIPTDDMKHIVREQGLGDVATVCPDGTPNLSPKRTTAVWDDDHLV